MKTNTEKAIEFLNDCQDDYEELQEEGNNKGILEVIRLLEEGEKYKKMWGELENEGENYPHSYIATTKYLMDNIKQRYFPKPKDRWHKINNTIYNLDTIGGYVDIKELINLLIELRDEEL
jgi:hypothetical protein